MSEIQIEHFTLAGTHLIIARFQTLALRINAIRSTKRYTMNFYKIEVSMTDDIVYTHTHNI